MQTCMVRAEDARSTRGLTLAATYRKHGLEALDRLTFAQVNVGGLEKERIDARGISNALTIRQVCLLSSSL